MRAIRWLLFLPLILSSAANAAEEYWGIYQFRNDLSSSHFLFSEYVRRDTNTFFGTNNLDLVRFSIGGKVEGWTYLVGGAYVNFATSDDERRLHQFFIRSFNLSQYITAPIRLGLEQRSFISNENLYFRARLRGQVNFPVWSAFGFAAYDEMLLALNGANRFYQGLNENRLGFGIRLKFESVEALLFHTQAQVKTLRSETHPQWIQLQTIIQF